MAKECSKIEYEYKLSGILKKLEDNGMEVIDVFVNGEMRHISNTYITYKCKECGSISKPASIVFLSRRACKCPKQCHNLKWNYTSCFEAAKKCNSKTEFRERYGGAFSLAWKNGWLKDYTWLNRPTSKSSKWNYQTTYEEAKKYKSRYSFSVGSSGAYQIANANKWLDDYIWFTKSYQDVQHADIIDKINKRLKDFPDLYFDENEFAYYKAGRNRKITLHCKKHPDEIIVRNLRSFLYGRVPNISYCKRCVDEEQLKYTDFDEMVEELKKYKTLREARQKDACLIDHLRKTKEGRKYVYRLERANSAWKRGIYSYEFCVSDKKYVYVGLTCDFERRDKDHRQKKDSSVFNFSVKHNVEIPKMKKETKYIDWDLASNKEIEYMEKYQERGYILINIKPGGSLGSVNFKKRYTLDEAKESIRKNKYVNINDISHRNWALYNQIIHHINGGEEEWGDLLPKLTRKEPNYWTRERVVEIFTKFNSVADIMNNGYGSAYRAYLKRYRDDEELNQVISNKKIRKKIS